MNLKWFSIHHFASPTFGTIIIKRRVIREVRNIAISIGNWVILIGPHQMKEFNKRQHKKLNKHGIKKY